MSSKSTRVKRDGFAGQHMLVVPAPIRRALAGHPLLRGLFVTDAGFFPKASGHRVERPQGAATDLLIACKAGLGWVREGSTVREVKAGDLAWIPADLAHSYGADEKDPWTITWVHFRGEELPAWRSQLADNQPGIHLLRVHPDRLGDLRLEQACDQLQQGYAVPQLLAAAAALRMSLCSLLQVSQSSSGNRSATERTLAVRDVLCEAPAREYRLEDLALSARLSVPHFSALFRHLTGYPPVDFLIRQRIRRACHLLDTSDQSISSIAETVGFKDPYYFSRCFRRIMGCAPLAYRQTVKA